MCARAESAGAGALWACDHLFWHTPNLECLSAVTLAALATNEVTVGSCVMQLPLRSPQAVAKQVASISHLSEGRTVLGVGVGARRGEYLAAGEAFASRASRLDKGIETLRRAWSGAGPTGYLQLPPPPRVPIWIGGSSEAALRRAARLGDGWIPLFISPSEYGPAMERLDKEADRARRDPAVITRAMVVFAALGGGRVREAGLDWMASLYSLAPSAFRGHLLAGTATQVADMLGAYLDAGASHVAVFVTNDDPLAAFEDLAAEVLGRAEAGVR